MASGVKMNAAIVPANANVESFVDKIDPEAQLVPIERKRARKVGHPEYRSDVHEIGRSLIHGRELVAAQRSNHRCGEASFGAVASSAPI